MKTQMMDIKTQDGVCDAFIAYPEDAGVYPAILFFMDGFGLRDYLYEMAKTIASRGYYVLLPNMFYRIRRAPVTDIKFPLRPEDMAEARQKLMLLFKNYDPQFGVKDTAIFLDFLAKQNQVMPDKIGATGYCMGGGLSIRAAIAYPDRIKAAASFHAGNLATTEPNSLHLLLDRIKAELYIAHADNDQSMPAEQIERLHSALEKAGLRYEAELYSGAAHGFTMADLPSYNEAALQRHWNKLFKLFERSLGTFDSLKSNISDAIKEACPKEDSVTYKIADEVYHIKTVTVEPGVEIARSLSTVIDRTVKDSVHLGCDLSVIAQGILIGAFRSRSLQLEAHKTIRLLAQEIVRAVINHKGDLKKAIDGLMSGIVAVAKEHKLNEQEALMIVNESLTEVVDKN